MKSFNAVFLFLLIGVSAFAISFFIETNTGSTLLTCTSLICLALALKNLQPK
jgi:hypothetical protein